MTRTMKISILTLMISMLSLGAQAQSYGPQSKKLGVGLQVGEPTGLSAKGYLSSQTAVQLGVGWSFSDEELTLAGDFIWELYQFNTSGQDTVTVPLYVGAGGKLRLDNDDSDVLTARFPIGVAAQWVDHPFEVYLEIAPGMDLVPDTKFDISGVVGARYYF